MWICSGWHWYCDWYIEWYWLTLIDIDWYWLILIDIVIDIDWYDWCIWIFLVLRMIDIAATAADDDDDDDGNDNYDRNAACGITKTQRQQWTSWDIMEHPPSDLLQVSASNVHLWI